MCFEKLQQNLRKAEKDMEAALSDKWPEGSRVEVFLNCRQQTPTDGVVVGHNGQGYVHVKIASAKKNSRTGVRNIYFYKMGESCQKPFRKQGKQAT